MRERKTEGRGKGIKDRKKEEEVAWNKEKK